MAEITYRTIVADPPWTFESAATKADARKHYGTMTLSDIARLAHHAVDSRKPQAMATSSSLTERTP